MGSAVTQTQTDTTKLELVRRETLEKMEHLRHELRTMAEPTADEADSDAYEREKTLALVQSLERKLESIERAIQLARQGRYGICEDCGDRIDPARLEILPQATLCLKCQRALERRNRRGRY
jgi:RNA polymerase-binding protein DksA